MKLFITEKPSVALDIGKIIGVEKRMDGYLITRSGDMITWVIGHMLEQPMPNEYSERWAARWSWDTLPIVPDTWFLKPVDSKKKQLSVIKKLLKESQAVVIATDAGREGELIARELLEYFKFNGKIERLWLSVMTDGDIRKALNNLLPGESKLGLYHAALSRQRADYVYGNSLSRGVSLAWNRTTPIGRVKTPTLAMVVRRDLEIENFKPREYYELEANVRTKNNHELTLKHAPKDEKDRIFDRVEAERRLHLAEGAQGPLVVKRKSGADTPPIPYTLAKLQKDASSKLGLSAADTLKVAQSLYEKKVLSYPRTDCPYLSTAFQSDIPEVLKAVSNVLPGNVDSLNAMGHVFRRKVFDDSKITDHPGLTPTTYYTPLSGIEERLYKLVAVRFMQSIAPDRLYDGTRIDMDANGIPFSTTGKVITSPGWASIQF